VQGEDGQEGARLRSRDHDLPPGVIDHLEPTEQPDAHRRGRYPGVARLQRSVSVA
jgi:hypothetical protein